MASIGSSSKSAAALLLLAALSACHRPQPVNARVDAAIAPLIPGDTVILAGLRLDRLKDTPFFLTYVQGGRLKWFSDFRRQTGLDPAKDVWELVLAVSPGRALVFVRGKFGGEFGLEPKFDVPGMQRASHKGYYILHQDGRGILFLNSGVAVVGQLPDIKAVIDNRDRNSEQPPLELIELVKTLPPDHAWLVARQPGALLAGLPLTGNLGNLSRLAGAMARLTAHADLSGDAKLELEGDYPDSQSALGARDVLRGAAGLARLRLPAGASPARQLLEGLRVEARDNTLTVSLAAPAAVLLDAVAPVNGKPAGKSGD